MTITEIRVHMEGFLADIKNREVKEKTLQQYRRDIERFLNFADGVVELTKKLVGDYKKMLLEKYKPATAVIYLMTVNRIIKWAGMGSCCVALPKLQKRFSIDNPLEENDYRLLLDYAKANGKRKYYCIMRTLAITGIRIGELKFVTYESLEYRKVCVTSKKKIREIYYTDDLISVLKEYAKECGITSGPLFVGNTPGKSIDVSAVWQALKRMAKKSLVKTELVFPHNFRHMFARKYMQVIGNIAQLADLLGHSRLETTRIYTMGTAEEKRSSLSLLCL